MTTIDILKKTKAAWQHISNASAEEKNALLLAMADSLLPHQDAILAENRRDLAALRGPLSEPWFWVAVLYLSVASSVCAFLLINFSVNYISVAKASLFSNFTTVISVLAGIFIMKDSFSSVQLAGIVIITLSIFGVSFRREDEALSR